MKKLLFSIFICLFVAYPSTIFAGSYTLDFEHHNYRDTTIEYKYVQQGKINWSSYVSTAVSRWNSKSVPYPSTKPNWGLGTLTYDEMIFSNNYGITDWNGNWNSYPTMGSFNSYGHSTSGMTQIRVNDYNYDSYNSDQLKAISYELIRILEHEMGHELGLGDVNDSSVIMYQYTPEVDYPTTSDLQGVASKCTLCNAE